MENVYLSWKDVTQLIDRIAEQVTGHLDGLIAVSRGGIVPAGLLSKSLDIRQVFIASVSFFQDENQQLDWPVYLQFPEDRLLRGKRFLVVDDLWVHGRTVTSVRERTEQAGGEVVTAVLHYQPASPDGTDPVPDIFAQRTQDHIIYPWQAERGKQQV
jgi:uncharacterized protein